MKAIDKFLLALNVLGLILAFVIYGNHLFEVESLEAYDVLPFFLLYGYLHFVIRNWKGKESDTTPKYYRTFLFIGYILMSIPMLLTSFYVFKGIQENLNNEKEKELLIVSLKPVIDSLSNNVEWNEKPVVYGGMSLLKTKLVDNWLNYLVYVYDTDKSKIREGLNRGRLRLLDKDGYKVLETDVTFDTNNINDKGEVYGKTSEGRIYLSLYDIEKVSKAKDYSLSLYRD
ncbi:hypothetical protein [Roseivirga thermotolerans]|uniref:hypothetical protein n=1 Tax=Roseivirga thermotolerans TaxID=1758176 RepID=UPI00273EF4B4|nr:hypothetical protein [Roseivirga thermotolerans]